MLISVCCTSVSFFWFSFSSMVFLFSGYIFIPFETKVDHLKSRIVTMNDQNNNSNDNRLGGSFQSKRNETRNTLWRMDFCNKNDFNLLNSFRRQTCNHSKHYFVIYFVVFFFVSIPFRKQH